MEVPSGISLYDPPNGNPYSTLQPPSFLFLFLCFTGMVGLLSWVAMSVAPGSVVSSSTQTITYHGGPMSNAKHPFPLTLTFQVPPQTSTALFYTSPATPVSLHFSFSQDSKLETQSDQTFTTQGTAFWIPTSSTFLFHGVLPTPFSQAMKDHEESIEEGELCEFSGILDAANPNQSTDSNFRGAITSPMCSLTMPIQMVSSFTPSTTNLYDLLPGSLALVKLILDLIMQTKQMHESETPSMTQKVSVFTLFARIVLELFELFFLIVVSIFTSYVGSYFFLFFFLKISVIAGYIRYIELIINAQRQADITGSSSYLWWRKPTWIRMGILVAIVISFLLYGTLAWTPHMFIFFYFFWVPQILRDAWNAFRNSLTINYLLWNSFSALMLPLFLFLIPNLVWNDSSALLFLPSVSTFSTVTILLGMQLVIIISQRILGPRFILPRRFLPNVYDYYRTPDFVDPLEGPIDCVICMAPLNLTNKKCCVTPCDHLFHGDCLLAWMDVKKECPVCRRVLPQYF